MRLYTKIIALIFSLTLLISVSSYFLVNQFLKQATETELQDKGSALAHVLAEHITHNVIERDPLTTRDALEEIVDHTKSVDFAYVFDFEGRVFAHSFKGGFPRALLTAHTPAPPHEQMRIKRFITSRGKVIEFAFPLINGMKAELHIGLSEQAFLAQIAKLRDDFLDVVWGSALFGVLLGLVLSRRVSKPLENLTRAMKSFGTGAPAKALRYAGGGAEIEQLTATFNNMLDERLQAESALKQQNLRTQLILDTMMDGYILADIRGQIKQVNDSYCRMVGYSKEELLSMKIMDVEANMQKTDIEKLIQKTLAEQHVRFETRHRTKTDELIELEVSVSILQTPEESLVAGFVRDITESKRLGEERQRLIDILESTPDFVGISDATGRVIFVNEALRNFAGFFKEEDVSGKTIADFHPEQTSELILNVGIPSAIQDGTWKGETHFVSPDGRLVPTLQIVIAHKNPNGEVQYLSTIARDITDQKRTEHILRESERNYREIFNATTDAIFVHDAESGAIVDVNQAALEMYNCTYEEALQVTGDDFSLGEPPYTAEDAIQIIRQMKERGRPQIFEWHARKMTGETFWVEVGLRLATITGKKRVLAVVRDITQRKRTEAALRESEKLFRSVVEQSGEGIYIADFEGNFALANEELCRMTGYTKDQLLHANVKDLLPEDTSLKLFPRVKRGQSGVREIQLQREDGSLFESEVSAYPIDLGYKKLVLGIVRDITERRQAEQKLRESEERYRRLVLYNPAAIIVHKQGEIVFANPAAFKLIGAGEEQIILGKSVLDFVHPDYRQVVEKRMQKIHKQRKYAAPMEEKFLRLDGEIVDVEATGIPVTYQGEPATQVVFWDITDRKLAEEKLKQSEQDYRGVFENAHDAIIIFDPENEIIFDANPRSSEIYGFTREEFIGMSLKKISKDAAKGKERIQKTLKKGMHHNFETVHFRKDGSEMNLEINAAVIDYKGRKAILSINRDITDRKRAEQAVKASEESYRKLFDNAPDAIYIQDREGRFIDVNRSAVKMYGYPKSYLVGKSPVEVSAAGKNDLEKIFQKVQKAFQGRNQRFEFWGQRKNGEVFPKDVRLARGSYFGQEVVYAFARDITEQKRINLEIRQLNRELEKRVQERTANLLAVNRELEAFSYSVSHDLRAPLRGINGFSQALLEDYHDLFDERGKDYLRRVRKASERMGRLIDDLLTLSRLSREEMTLETVDLSKLARETIADLQQADPERQVQWKVQPNLSVTGDKKLLRILLANLLGNAWKFTGKTDRARIELGKTTRKGKTVFFVRDNGAGFDMEFADKLFGPFQRLHSQTEFEGTGIGLATVQRIMHRHNGSVWAEGKEGKGAIFYFQFQPENPDEKA